jgi:hypothetical protein
MTAVRRIAALALVTCSAVAHAQQFVDRYVRRDLPIELADSRAVVAVDLDGDGDLDLAFARDGEPVRVCFNDGFGRFDPAPTAWQPTAGAGPGRALDVADLDGDGDPDLVVGYLEARNRILVNTGTGLVDETALRLPDDVDPTTALAFGDLDGDGDLDLVVANGVFRRQDRLFVNDGRGRFHDASSRLPTRPLSTRDLALADLDGDGDLDVVLASDDEAGPADRILVNDGSGHFVDESASRLPPDDRLTLAVAVGDLDGDGDIDLVFGDRTRDRLLINDGSGVFAEQPVARLPATDTASEDLVLADVDGDLDLDLVVARAGAPDQLFINDGGGNFRDATSGMSAAIDESRAVTAADLDGDGHADLVFANRGPDRIDLGDGNGVFASTVRPAFPSLLEPLTNALVLADFDGDGDLDAFLANGGDRYSADSLQDRLFVNDGTGCFADETAGRLPVDRDLPYHAVAGDLDGDGDLDLVVGHGGSLYRHTDRLLLNDGSGRFADATAGRLPQVVVDSTAMRLGDVDGDGDLDLVVGQSTLFRNLVLINDGGARFVDETPARLPDHPWLATEDLALGDVDGDGDLDLVVAVAPNNQTRRNRLYLNDATGHFVDATVQRLPDDSFYSEAVALGDLDGDGDLDILFGNGGYGPAQAALYVNDGAGHFVDASAQRLPAFASHVKCVALADVDLDQDLDIVLGNMGDPFTGLGGEDRLLLNDGRGRFALAALERLGLDSVRTEDLAVGDIDADGDPDLLVGRPGPRGILRTNLHRQLTAPLSAQRGASWTLEVHGQPGYAAGVGAFVLLLNTALAPAPIAVPPFGQLFLATTNLVDLPPLPMPAGGLATVVLPIPDDPGLRGLTIGAQALLAGSSAMHLTNLAVDLVRGP